jgi:hypothetical protein
MCIKIKDNGSTFIVVCKCYRIVFQCLSLYVKRFNCAITHGTPQSFDPCDHRGKLRAEEKKSTSVLYPAGSCHQVRHNHLCPFSLMSDRPGLPLAAVSAPAFHGTLQDCLGGAEPCDLDKRLSFASIVGSQLDFQPVFPPRLLCVPYIIRRSGAVS